MRKLGRIFRRVMTAVSLVVFVAVLAAWVRGYWHLDMIFLGREVLDEQGWRKRLLFVECGTGDLGIVFVSEFVGRRWAEKAGLKAGGWWLGDIQSHRNPGSAAEDLRDPMFTFDGSGVQSHRISEWGNVVSSQIVTRGAMGIGEDRSELVDGYSEISGRAFPSWMGAIVFGALPFWRGWVWWRGVRGRRLALLAGRCGVCGYDLRASQERCPECGKVVGGGVGMRHVGT